jgi:hypothetical protein
MVVLIIVGWTLALPAVVVIGLSVAARMLSARARGADAGADVNVTALAREFVGAKDAAVLRPLDKAPRAACRLSALATSRGLTRWGLGTRTAARVEGAAVRE